MVLKVDPDELLDVTKVMKKDIEKYNKEIANIEKSIELIRKNWIGVDAETFTINFSNFVKKMKAIPKTLETLSSTTDKMNELYTTRDKEFARAIKEAAVNNE